MSNSTAHQPTDLPIATLFRHNLWANLVLLDACAALSEEQLDATVAGTYGTIINTLRHIVRAEHGYIWRLTGGDPAQRPQLTADYNVAELRPLAVESGEALIAAAQASRAGDTVDIPWSEDGSLIVPVPEGMILTQAINHSTEHRAHVATILTQLGIAPPPMDSWAFVEVYVDSLT